MTILSFLQNDKIIDVAEPVCTGRVINPLRFPGIKGFLGCRTSVLKLRQSCAGKSGWLATLPTPFRVQHTAPCWMSDFSQAEPGSLFWREIEASHSPSC